VSDFDKDGNDEFGIYSNPSDKTSDFNPEVPVKWRILSKNFGIDIDGNTYV
jgi:hypothetical protein